MFVLHMHTIQNVNQHTQTGVQMCLLHVQSDKKNAPLTFRVSSSCRIRIRGASSPTTRPERQRLQQRCTNEQRGCVLSAQEPPSPRSPPSLSSSILLSAPLLRSLGGELSNGSSGSSSGPVSLSLFSLSPPTPLSLSAHPPEDPPPPQPQYPSSILFPCTPPLLCVHGVADILSAAVRRGGAAGGRHLGGALLESQPVNLLLDPHPPTVPPPLHQWMHHQTIKMIKCLFRVCSQKKQS